jgi:hypothetical protein
MHGVLIHWLRACCCLLSALWPALIHTSSRFQNSSRKNACTFTFCYCAAMLSNMLGMLGCGECSSYTAGAQRYLHSKMVPSPIASSTESFTPPALAAAALEAVAAGLPCALRILLMGPATSAAAVARLLAVLPPLLWEVGPSESGLMIFYVLIVCAEAEPNCMLLECGSSRAAKPAAEPAVAAATIPVSAARRNYG